MLTAINLTLTSKVTLQLNGVYGSAAELILCFNFYLLSIFETIFYQR